MARVRTNKKDYFYDTKGIQIGTEVKDKIKQHSKDLGMTYTGFLKMLLNKYEN